MYLVGCPYCSFEGVEKYNVTQHIKEVHKGKPLNIKFTQPDVGNRVREFVEDMSNVAGIGQNLIKKPDSRSSSPSVKLEKSDEDGDEKEDTEADESSAPPSLVVAMFGKKKKIPESPLASQDSEFVVKTEVEDEEFQEGDALDSADLKVHFNEDEEEADSSFCVLFFFP